MDIKKLIETMEKHGLTRLRVKEGDQEVEMEKGGVAIPVASPPAASSLPPVAPEGEVILSPMVGMFYPSSSPEAGPFVKVGDPVDENTVVCIIEAMKVMNEVKAGIVGTIKEVLVENGQPIEFGTPLFKVEHA